MEKHALRAISRKTGCSLLAVCALQQAVSFGAARLPALEEELRFNVMLVLSSLTVLAGALLGRKLLRNEMQEAKGKPCPLFPDIGLLTLAGAALCMAGNFVAVFVERLAGRAGVEFTGGPERMTPQSVPGLLLMLLTVGVFPAVAEELLLRGVILPPLRRFGDGFAVLCTAALFALLHQNMEQAPMAFVSGLALGWVYVRSGRLAVPVAVHLWNNAAAVALMLLPGSAADVYTLGLGLLGMLCLLILYLRRPAPQKIVCEMPAYRRASNFFFGSAAMVLALAYFIVVIAMNTRVG